MPPSTLRPPRARYAVAGSPGSAICCIKLMCMDYHGNAQSAPEELVPEAVVQPEIVNTRPRSRTSTLSKNAPMMYMTAGDLQHSCDLWLTARDLAVITGQQPVKPMGVSALLLSIRMCYDLQPCAAFAVHTGAKEMPKLNQWEKKLAANLLTPGVVTTGILQ